MKRVEVKLSLPVVEPLLEVIVAAAESLDRSLAVLPLMPDIDREFRDTWNAELLASQNSEVRAFVGLFEGEFSKTGVIGFDEGNAESMVRACAAIRLQLRARFLPDLGDEALETGDIEFPTLPENVRKAFMAYLFLATIQELIIHHLDSSILES